MLRGHSSPLLVPAVGPSPRRQGVKKSGGLTTIPSPPRRVRSNHQSVASDSERGSVRSTMQWSVTQISGAQDSQSLASVSHMPAMTHRRVDLALGGEQVERGNFEIVD